MKIIYCIKKLKKVKVKVKVKVKRKGRIYKIIQSKIETQDKIAQDIIQVFNSNSLYF